MDTDLSEAEAIEFLDYIIQATDKMGTLLDQYELEPVFLPPHSQGIATTTAS